MFGNTDYKYTTTTLTHVHNTHDVKGVKVTAGTGRVKYHEPREAAVVSPK